MDYCIVLWRSLRMVGLDTRNLHEILSIYQRKNSSNIKITWNLTY